MEKIISEDHSPLGRHIIADFFKSENLDDLEFIKRALVGAAKAAGATVLGFNFHKFSPQGVTGYVLLAESHISIHTWPEYGYAAADIFTCGKLNPQAAFDFLKLKLGAGSVQIKDFQRGVEPTE